MKKRKESLHVRRRRHTVPPEEICAQAQGNAAAWILTIIAYLKERGGAVEDCAAYHGRSFAPVWEWLRGRPVEEVAQLVALNVLSVGLRCARYLAKTGVPRCSSRASQTKNS